MPSNSQWKKITQLPSTSHAAHKYYQKKRLDEIKMSSLKKCLQGDLLESEQPRSYSTVLTQSQQVNIT